MPTRPLDEETYRLTVEAVERHGGDKAAAGAELGVDPRTIGDRLKRGAQLGFAPGHFNNGVAPGYVMGKVTVQRGKTGDVERTWERQSPDQQKMLEALQAAIDGLTKGIEPVAATVKPNLTLKHLLTLYTFTDYHVGCLAWHKEGGADWDLEIAERMGIAAMRGLVAGAPQSDTAIINIQGDFMHFDGLLPITPTHGHVLDADSRFGKVVDVAIRLIRQLVALALFKHRNVTLLICEGNHDVVSSLWLRKLFACLYEKEPRITVHASETPYYAMEWGQTMLGFHHGHMRKNDQLPLLFAAQFSEIWGRTKRRYINTGHRHHKEDKEHAGARVIQHQTLAARDAHASRGGWHSERAITAMTFHKSFGEVGTNTVTPEMLEAA